jgi:hypothetical protein
MIDYAAFLTARLDEDEQVAKAAEREMATWGGQWPSYAKLGFDVGDLAQTFNPARVLREVAAGRAILAEHPHHYEDAAHPEYGFGCDTCHWDNEYSFGREIRWCATLRALAAVYSDHPGYDEAPGSA